MDSKNAIAMPISAKPRLIFFGNEQLATGLPVGKAPLLSGLIAAGYDIAAVVVHQSPGRSRKSSEPAVESVARAHAIPLLIPSRPADCIDKLKSFGAAAGILAAYGKIIPQSVIDIFPRGIINLHPSLLPKYRGPTPLETVILDDARLSGASIMMLVKTMDAGPVYAQATVTLSGNESKSELAAKLLQIGRQLLLEHLPAILEGSLTATAQDDRQASYTQMITKASGILDWQKPAAILEREIRAFHGWPQCSTNLAGIELIVTEASTSSDWPLPAINIAPGALYSDNKRLLVRCGDNSTLLISRLKPAGKAEMPIIAFLAGYGKALATA